MWNRNEGAYGHLDHEVKVPHWRDIECTYEDEWSEHEWNVDMQDDEEC